MWNEDIFKASNYVKTSLVVFSIASQNRIRSFKNARWPRPIWKWFKVDFAKLKIVVGGESCIAGSVSRSQYWATVLISNNALKYRTNSHGLLHRRFSVISSSALTDSNSSNILDSAEMKVFPRDWVFFNFSCRMFERCILLATTTATFFFGLEVSRKKRDGLHRRIYCK